MFGNTPPPAHVGPFVVLRELGRGGMGVVYVARDPVTGRDVAVKQILAEGASGPALERFLREAEALGRVKHKGVVGVHQLGRTKDGPYIVAELIEGEPLSAVVTRGALEPMLAARLVRDVSDAIAAVHALGIIHRDLKPANVMLRKDGSPVLLDFGLARDINSERLTKTGDVLGTVAYMAPEQADGKTKDLDERVDVYALGAVLFELLSGAPPHSGSSYQMVVNILTKPPPRLRDRSPLAPAALDAVCAMAMASERGERYQSVRALRDDLDRFLRGETTQAAKRLAAAEPRRGRVVVAAALVTLALGVAIGVFVAKRGRTAPAGGDDGGIASVPSKTAATGPPRLWRVAPGQQLLYGLDLKEEANHQQLDLGAKLRLNVLRGADEGQVKFECELAALSCAIQSEFALLTFDSAALETSSGDLVALGAAIEIRFHCTIDPISGAVTIVGLQKISDAVRRDAERRTGVSPGLDTVLQRVFTDEFIGRSMHALTCVRSDEVRTVPWVEGDEQTFTVAADTGVVLDSLGATAPLGSDQRYRLVGESRYVDGRVSTATLTQATLDAPPQATFTLTWSMTLSQRR